MPERSDPFDAPPGERVRLYLMFVGVMLAYYAAAVFLGLEPSAQLVGPWLGGLGLTLIFGGGYALALVYRTLLEMPPSWGELGGRLRERLLGPAFLERVAGILLVTVAILTMYDVYATFKPAMPRFRPYVLDPPLADVDRLIHLGRDPWLWLHALPGREWITSFLDVVYILWFEVKALAMVGVLLFAPFAARLRFFIGFVLLWALGGSLLGTAFASGGPAFYEGFTGDGARFTPLLTYLDGTAPLARALQVDLWTAFTDPNSGMLFAGISAMPSLHVAVVTYFAYWALRTGPRLGAVAVAYAVLTFLGSVHLGWHYAVDGYAGAVVGWVAAWGAERLLTNGEAAVGGPGETVEAAALPGARPSSADPRAPRRWERRA